MRDIDEIYDVFDGDPWPYGVEDKPADAGSARHLSAGSASDRRKSPCRWKISSSRITRTGAIPAAVRRYPGHRHDGAISHEQSRQDHQGSRHRQPHPGASEDVVDAYGHVSVRHPDNPNHFFLVALARARSWSSPTTSSSSASTASRCARRSARSIWSASSMPRSSRRAPRSMRSCMPMPRTSCRSASRRRRRCARSSIPAASSARTCRCGTSPTSSATPISW